MSITKSDLISDTAVQCGITRDNAKIAIEQFFDVVKSFVKTGNAIEIKGFGAFLPKNYNPRKARNLQTGELISLAARKGINLKFSPELKAKIAGSVSKAKSNEAATKPAQAHELAKMNSL